MKSDQAPGQELGMASESLCDGFHGSLCRSGVASLRESASAYRDDLGMEGFSRNLKCFILSSTLGHAFIPDFV